MDKLLKETAQKWEITIFKDILSTSTGFHRPVKEIFERIIEGTSKNTVLEIRKEKDKEKRNILKKKLPAICFSGVFNQRTDSSLIRHSGLICLDFDNFITTEELIKERTILIKDKYTFAIFVSPGGNGLKLVVKIPPDILQHRLAFRSLQSYYNSKYFDESCINESRVCYESFDPDLWINEESLIFDKLLSLPVLSVGKDKSSLKLKSENQIIQNLMKWFEKNYTTTEGNRNTNYFILASAFNDFGIPLNETEKTLYHFISDTFPAREMDNILKSAYKNTGNFGTKFFEDDHTKEKIKIKIRAGDDLTNIKRSFNQYSPVEIEEAISDIKKELSITEFWDYDKNNRISLSHHKYKQFLEQNGYFKMFPKGSENFIFILKKENLICNTSSNLIKDFILNYLYNKGETLKPYDFMASATKYFKDDYLNLLDTANVALKEDTKELGYLYFKNKVVEVSKNGIRTFNYMALNGFVWEKHIIGREYEEIDPTGCIFERFILKVAGDDKKRFISITSVIGYLLHSHKTNSNNKAIIMNDETISETPNGGSGKGIICNAIAQMKRVATIDGKQFDFNKSFLYQTVSADTQVLVFDDVKKNFQFENLFSLVTEGITLEKKNKDAIKLPVHQSPKIVITTNYTVSGEGGSFDRRKFEIELSSHFNKNHTPYDEFGQMLFDDWDDMEWLKFYNFMIMCLQHYLNKGLINYSFHNLDTRKLINATCYEFYEWIEEEVLETDIHISKNDMFETFLNEFGEFRKWLSKRKFSRWLDLYATHKGYDIVKGKYNGLRFTLYKKK